MTACMTLPVDPNTFAELHSFGLVWQLKLESTELKLQYMERKLCGKYIDTVTYSP